MFLLIPMVMIGLGLYLEGCGSVEPLKRSRCAKRKVRLDLLRRFFLQSFPSGAFAKLVIEIVRTVPNWVIALAQAHLTLKLFSRFDVHTLNELIDNAYIMMIYHHANSRKWIRKQTVNCGSCQTA